MVSSDHFRQELYDQMRRAVARGAKDIVVNARELHCALGDFLGRQHQPKCCEVMEQAMMAGDIVLADKTDPYGMTIRYQLSRG